MSTRAPLAFFLLGSLACSSAEERAARQSAAHVARSVEVLRNAPNAAKAEPLAALAKLACSGPEVCAVRDACRDAYALHVEALTLTAAAKQKLADDQPLEAAKLLGSSERKLQEADARVSRCTDREAALRRRYKL